MTVSTTTPSATPSAPRAGSSATAAAFARQARTALVLLLAATVVLGLLYPLAVFGVGRLVPGGADGRLVEHEGRVVGSALLGQEFAGDEWFQPRPSVAGDGYDPLSSGASNLGPSSAELLATVEERRAEVAARDGVAPADVAPDALTASGSGLDPDVSPRYARQQVQRVARERGLEEAAVAALVEQHVQDRALGFLGAPRVNVLELNLALDRLAG
ncbi:potassium-transporting ATPase subunit KdpC [Kineococcus terrestris]|uniref:potassium-transporting ATPase subunit KdpC n=1 Tax=Kineococcus terrestris TaxID=2044856 RepID=UPI00359F6A9F